jgi:hypothetical protein
MGDQPGDGGADAAAGKGVYEGPSLTDTEELTVKHVKDDQPMEQVLNEQVLNNGFFDDLRSFFFSGLSFSLVGTIQEMKMQNQLQQRARVPMRKPLSQRRKS